MTSTHSGFDRIVFNSGLVRIGACRCGPAHPSFQDTGPADGRRVHSSFKSVISGTTLMETLSPAGMEEMLSLYTVDGDGIQLNHYCPTNNQPRTRAVPAGANPKELDFQFIGACNLPDISVGHQHGVVIRFEDADHIVETWTWRHGDHDMPMVFHLTRKH